MSYQSIAQLTGNAVFAGRVDAAATEQAETFKDDQRPDFVSLSQDLLRGEPAPLFAFVRTVAAAPGIGDMADNGDGTISQEQVTDGDILSAVQANYPTVVALFYSTP